MGLKAKGKVRPLTSSEWRLLHSLYSLEEHQELITAVSLRERLRRPPYSQDMQLNHVQVLLVRLEAAGYVISAPIPRKAGQRGRMEYSYSPAHEYEAVFEQVARSVLEDLIVGSDPRGRDVLRRLLEDQTAEPSSAPRRQREERR